MAGHSKFANIKHKKEKEDSKRGKAFAQLGKEIIIATKLGGKDLNFNPRLRLAIEKAKAANVPKDNIEKAIKKGAGELEGETILELRYEGYGVGGVAVLVDVVTDNKNRSAGEIRHAFTKFGGSLGDVAWNFNKKGVILINKDVAKEDEVMTKVLEHDIEDVLIEDDYYVVLTSPDKFYEIKDSIDLDIEDSYIDMVPNAHVSLEGDARETFEKMIDFVKDIEDVKEVYTNLE